MIVAVLPIIGVEACVLWARLGVGFEQALEISGVANIISTVIGIPLVWFIGGIAGQKASGLLPRSNAPWRRIFSLVVGSLGLVGERHSRWVIPSVLLVLLVPFFFLSWLIELLVASRMLEEAGSALVLGSVFLANLASHSLLVLVPLFELSRARESLAEVIREARVIHVVHAGLAPDGRIFVADHHGTIRFFDADSGQQVLAQDPIREELTCLAVSSDSRFAV